MNNNISKKIDSEDFDSRTDIALMNYVIGSNDVANLFCEKHDFYPVANEGENDDFCSFWANDEPGSTLFCGDMCFSMSEIILDLEENVEPMKIVEYWDYQVRTESDKLINYKTWLKTLGNDK